MGIITKQKISPKGKLNAEDLHKMAMNCLIFSAPALSVFFAQLALGVEPQAALLVALLVLWGLLADFFKKIGSSK